MKLLKYGNLEVIAGILAWHYFSASAIGAPIDFVNFIVLGFAVASIYLADRLLDNHFDGGGGGRHQFYAAYSTMLYALVLLFGIIGGVVALLFLPLSTLWLGLGLGAAIGFYYYAVVYKKWLPFKEIWMSMLLVAGVWLPFLDITNLQQVTLIGLEYAIVVASMFMIVGKEHQLKTINWGQLTVLASGENLQKAAMVILGVVALLILLVPAWLPFKPLLWQIGAYFVLFIFREELGSYNYRLLVDLGYCSVLIGIHLP